MSWRLATNLLLLPAALALVLGGLRCLASRRTTVGPWELHLGDHARLSVGVAMGWPTIDYAGSDYTPYQIQRPKSHSFAGVHWIGGRTPAGMVWSLRIHPILGVLTSLLVIYAWLRARRRLKERTAGLCAACGYDLRATPERCPSVVGSPMSGRHHPNSRLKKPPDLASVGFSNSPLSRNTPPHPEQ